MKAELNLLRNPKSFHYQLWKSYETKVNLNIYVLVFGKRCKSLKRWWFEGWLKSGRSIDISCRVEVRGRQEVKQEADFAAIAVYTNNSFALTSWKLLSTFTIVTTKDGQTRCLRWLRSTVGKSYSARGNKYQMVDLPQFLYL